ncbi:MAG: HD domain-containing phosphohydrolase [Gemmatimonadota bacterium]
MMREVVFDTERGKRWPFSPGIRLKLTGFLLPTILLLVIAVAASVTKVTESSIRRDLLQRGVSISRVVALSAGYSLLSGDRLALDSLAAETKNSNADIEYVSIRDTADNVLAHSLVEERGKAYVPPVRLGQLGTFRETEADEVARRGRPMIEFNTPIIFAGKRVGTVSVALSKESLLAAQREIRQSVVVVAAVFLVVAVLGVFLLASRITAPVEKLSSGVNELAAGNPFHPIPAKGRDELGELTRNFNRMARTILAQKDRLSRYAEELEEAYVSTVRVLAAAIDARDPYTLGHSTRVAQLSCELGRRLGYSREEIEHLEKACLFHDVGKIRTPDEILLKEHGLSTRELGIMRRHPVDGADILRMAPSLHRYIAVVQSHHEWYNGKGYPQGKKDSEIPVHAQIIALADALDSMTSNRPYRKALSATEAIEEIYRFRGTQFSPELTDAFVRMMQELPALDAVPVREART